MSYQVLVVGGAGYIGSHCVRQLLAAGHQPVVLDNLSFGHRDFVPEGVPFYQCDLGDKDSVMTILRAESIEIVMHFAAYAYVGESVSNPLKYYKNNVSATIELLAAMLEVGVKRFVFSSTCATFGIPEELPIHEKLDQRPINPYGQTKLDVERLLKSLAQSDGLSSAVFRYFNAAGAAEDGTIGEQHEPETHLIPLVIEAALGKRQGIKIFGDDYDTPDGTCLRDYVHVDDLARAHIAVFDQLMASEGQWLDYNLGTGVATSVREVIDAVEEVSGCEVAVEVVSRRDGDPNSLYADASKARKELDWVPQYKDINRIIQTAFNWHKDL